MDRKESNAKDFLEFILGDGGVRGVLWRDTLPPAINVNLARVPCIQLTPKPPTQPTWTESPAMFLYFSLSLLQKQRLSLLSFRSLVTPIFIFLSSARSSLVI